MKYALLFSLIVSTALLSCIKPERDNEYDPNNPCKAYVAGIVYNYDGSIPIAFANIALAQDSEIMYEVKSDINGKYNLNEIDPGIYDVEVRAPGYMLYTDSADLWAGREIDSADIYLHELFFDFEDIPINTPEPYRFQIVEGNWAVVDAPEQGHVYAGVKDIGVSKAVTHLDLTFRDCHVNVMINLLSTSTGYPGANLIVKHKDQDNFYWIGIGYDYIKMNKRQNGIDTVLYADHGVTFQYDHWYELRVEIVGNLFDVSVPGMTEFTINDAGWPIGKVGFFLINWDDPGHATEALFDDLYIDADIE